MRNHRWLLTVPVAVALVAATAGCSKSNEATTTSTAAPSTAGSSAPGTAPVTTPAVKTPGTTATTANGTSAPTTSSASGTGSTPTKPNQVVIKDFLFAPEAFSVKAGTEVVWANEDEFEHWVLADDKTSFDSNKLAQGATYAHTFATPGTFAYFCNIHNQMKGTIVVS